jgi:quercetin dioxygenase-like cupin family protein
MQTRRLEDMVKGWFVGDFDPAVIRTDSVEVAVKRYHAGDVEAWHYHKVATEVTVVISGEVEMGGKRFGAGDIVVMEPGEGTDFRAITDAVNAVVKIPSAKDDKYLGKPAC